MREHLLLTIFLLAAGLILSGCSVDWKDKTDNQNQEFQSEPVSIPTEIENNCVGFLTGAADETRTITEIGGAWTRPHPGPFAWGWIEADQGEYDFDKADEWVKGAQANNVAVMGTIWPYADWDQAMCYDKSCEVSSQDHFYPQLKKFGPDSIPKSRCTPCSNGNYQNFLIKLVERYDGDGLDDMPDLKIPIKYWEVLNEPEMNSSELTFYKGTPAEFVEIMKNSQEAIKSVCSDCQVLQGGMAGLNDDHISYWKNIFDLGGAEYFDIANIHHIGFGDTSTLNVAGFKKILDEKGISKPIWVTEAEIESEDEIASSLQGALQAGVEKVFFTQFEFDGYGPPKPGQYSSEYKDIANYCPNK